MRAEIVVEVLAVAPVFDYEAEAAGDPDPEFLGYVARVLLEDGRVVKMGYGRERPALGPVAAR